MSRVLPDAVTEFVPTATSLDVGVLGMLERFAATSKLAHEVELEIIRSTNRV